MTEQEMRDLLARLLGIIESQQRTIEGLADPKTGLPMPVSPGPRMPRPDPLAPQVVMYGAWTDQPPMGPASTTVTIGDWSAGTSSAVTVTEGDGE